MPQRSSSLKSHPAKRGAYFEEELAVLHHLHQGRPDYRPPASSTRPKPSLNQARGKLSWQSCTGKRELIGFSVNNSANTGGSRVQLHKENVSHMSSTKLSGVWSGGGEVEWWGYRAF